MLISFQRTEISFPGIKRSFQEMQLTLRHSNAPFQQKKIAFQNIGLIFQHTELSLRQSYVLFFLVSGFQTLMHIKKAKGSPFELPFLDLSGK